jgi:hypothetical protein
MKLAVVISNWKAAEDTAACLRAVRGWETARLPAVRWPIYAAAPGSADSAR